MQIKETEGQNGFLIHQGHIRVTVRSKGEESFWSPPPCQTMAEQYLLFSLNLDAAGTVVAKGFGSPRFYMANSIKYSVLFCKDESDVSSGVQKSKATAAAPNSCTLPHDWLHSDLKHAHTLLDTPSLQKWSLTPSPLGTDSSQWKTEGNRNDNVWLCRWGCKRKLWLLLTLC